jgi:hypothetical protein
MTVLTLANRTRAVNALRTTTFTQVHWNLSDGGNGRCANGVLCEAFGIRIPDDEVEEPDDLDIDPYSELERLGFDTTALYRLNDGSWWQDDYMPETFTFARIADWLERQPVYDEVADVVAERELVTV